MDSRQANSKPIVGTATMTAWSVAAGLVLGFAGIGSAQPSSASLLPPQPIAPVPTVIRGATPTGTDASPSPYRAVESTGETSVPPPEPPSDPPSVKARDGKIPPTFSSQRSKSFPVLGAAWKKIVGDGTSAPPIVPVPVKSASAAPVPYAVPIREDVGSPSPAWRWYGYGAPVPGQNPYAPQGTYAAVPARWYTETQATPGAIPNSPRPIREEAAPVYARSRPDVLPQPRSVPQPRPVSDAEVPQPMPPTRQDALILPPREETSSSESTRSEPLPAVEEQPRSKASLGMPTKPTMEDNADWQGPKLPTSGPTPEKEVRPVENREIPDAGLVLPDGVFSKVEAPPVTRAQAPSHANLVGLARIVEAIRSQCDERVLSLQVEPAGPKALVIRLETRTGADAQVVANRIARLKALESFHVIYQAVVR